MTPFEIAKLSCRIMALWLLAQAAIAVQSLVAAVIISLGALGRGVSMIDAISVPGLIVVMYLIVAFVLWIAAPRIAGALAGGMAGPITGDALTRRTAMEIACSAVGIFLFVEVMGPIAYDIFRAVQTHSQGIDTSLPNAPRMISEAVRLALSLWLIFGSRGVAKLIHWARTAGSKSAEEGRTCARCGYILHDSATQCSECGATLAGPATVQSPAQST